MARPAAWRYTLDEARRQALVAIDFYNRPGDRRSFSDFIVHIHLAWQNLLHADRMKRNAEIFYRESGGRRLFKRNPDGSKKTWDLSQCVKHEFKDNDPIKANIDFFIGLRNHVEHRFQDSPPRRKHTRASSTSRPNLSGDSAHPRLLAAN